MNQHSNHENKEKPFKVQKDNIRKNLLKYTRKAFGMLPKMDKPRILDIGCGSGIPTLELARLSQGEIIGIDIDKDALDKLAINIEKSELTNRVKEYTCSLFDMDFIDDSFDIIWSEGSIYAIGFERGIQEWKRLLKPDGFMVIHDEKENVEEKLKQVSDSGYELIGYFILSAEEWWTEYFDPLEKLTNEARVQYPNDHSILEELYKAEAEIDMYKKHPNRNSSVYFVLRKG